MCRAHRLLAACLATAVLAGAVAQEKQPPAAPRDPRQAHGSAQDLEPAVDTSVTPDDAQPKPVPHAATLPAPPAKPIAQPAGAAGQAKAKSGAKDRIELDTTQITGNRELPKVLYIVPWKRSDLSDLAGRPTNSLLDEVLMPVDRDVFKRENRYYGALNPDEPRRDAGASAVAPAAAAARDEK